MIDRQKVHGPFSKNAYAAQQLKIIVRDNSSASLSYEAAEALDNICQKMSRIITGSASYIDHWEDIQGYCERVLELIRQEEKIHNANKVENLHDPERILRELENGNAY